jgi:uncharacterized protein (TIGR03437 family)
MEGLHCYATANCNMQGFTLPVAEYGHSAGGCSVTGGYVYRGARSPGLRGTYLYGDYCNGMIWGLTRQGAQFTNRLILASGFRISTFGQDEGGEIYVAGADSGRIYRLQGTPPLPFNPSDVVNAASFAPGLVAGSLATIFVPGVRDTAGVSAAAGLPLPNTVDGVSITMDGTAAPILAVANVAGREQVNFQVPYGVRGRSTVAVVVRRGPDSSDPVTVPLLTEQPAIFTSAGSTLAVVVRNADYSLVTEQTPLAPGEYVFLYATGIGSATNEPPTGAAAPSSPLAMARGQIEATLNGLPCEIPFAGLAPGFAGVYQINLRIPQGAQPGIQTLEIRIGGVAAPPVTVPVR